MKTPNLILVLAMIFSCTKLPGQQLKAVPGDRRQADRDAIHAHIDSIFKAYMEGDRAKIEVTHSRDWRGFLGPSRTIIRGIDEYMQHADRSLKGPGFRTYKITDFDVMFYGDVALAPYIAQVGPEESHYKLRVLDVYAKLNGDWNPGGQLYGPSSGHAAVLPRANDRAVSTRQTGTTHCP